jgi:hypothetical protein
MFREIITVNFENYTSMNDLRAQTCVRFMAPKRSALLLKAVK